MRIVEFKDWFWEKFDEWRGKTVKGPTDFARYLGIRQQYVSNWLSGKYKPKSLEQIAKIAERFPEVYEVLGVQPFGGDLRVRLKSAVSEALILMLDNKIDPNSGEGKKIIADIAAKYGFTANSTLND